MLRLAQTSARAALRPRAVVLSRAFCDAPEDDPVAIQAIVDARILKKNQTGEIPLQITGDC